ncbi:MAG: hypothetical protein U0R69_01155 [Gaiellales bacterium]
MEKLFDPTLFRASVAVHVTVVTAFRGNSVPEGGLQVTVAITPSTRSVAVAVNVTTAPAGAGPVGVTVMFAGTETTGGVVSWTVMVKEPLAVALPLSVAEQLTVVVVIANVDPLAGRQFAVNGPPSSVSVQVAV